MMMNLPLARASGVQLHPSAAASLSACLVPARPGGHTRCIRLHGIARDILTSQAAHIEGDPLAFLDVTEQYWKALRAQRHEPGRKGPAVVTVAPEDSPPWDGGADGSFDVVVCGGTLGLMIATTLQRRGHKVAIVDKRLIQGRTQEWNISRGELQALAHVGLLTEAELNSTIMTEFNPVRCGFKGRPDIWVNDCLNLGVSPRKLLDLVKAKFVEAGGVLLENHSFRAAEVVPGEGVRLKLTVHGAGAAGAELGPGDVNRPNGLGGNSSNLMGPFTPVDSNGATPEPARQTRRRMELGTKLLLDCMGHYSDIVKQMRGRAKPDGMVLVAGSCAEGFSTANNTFGDLLYTMDDARDDMQVFWEAFPAEGGAARTTYMFAYSDAEPQRPSFESMLDKYFTELAKYQGVPASQLHFKRVLFGGFPCFSDGPLQPQWDHVMQVGDASATQSPLSFGGFGAMLRHLGRLTEGIDDALRCGALSVDDLKLLHPYSPSLSASWLFQRSMSVGIGQLHTANQEAAAEGKALPPMLTGALQVQAGPGPVPFVQLPYTQINDVLAANFATMAVLGDRCLRPFLQDTIQLAPLSLSMAGMLLVDPGAISRVLLQVGPRTLLAWFGHYMALVMYTTLHTISTPIRLAVRNTAKQSQGPFPSPSTNAGRSLAGYKYRRLFDAWEFGSSSDYEYHASDSPVVPPKILDLLPATATSFTPAPVLSPAKPLVAVAAPQDTRR